MSTGRLTCIPAALSNAGLKVEAVAGWETRGRPVMHPRVIVLHHTAAPMGRNAPSLNVCINGRSDLPGPLCHVLIGRDGTCYVIASGVANHAGTGRWKGITGNAHAVGIEVENVGTPAEPWHPDLVETMVRASRALAADMAIPPDMICGHKEWAPTRKIDPHTLSMDDIRRRIAARRPAPPVTPLPEDPFMADIVLSGADLERFVEKTYADAGQTLDKSGLAYWPPLLAFADDPKAALNALRTSLKLKAI